MQPKECGGACRLDQVTCPDGGHGHEDNEPSRTGAAAAGAWQASWQFRLGAWLCAQYHPGASIRNNTTYLVLRRPTYTYTHRVLSMIPSPEDPINHEPRFCPASLALALSPRPSCLAVQPVHSIPCLLRLHSHPPQTHATATPRALCTRTVTAHGEATDTLAAHW